MEDELNCHRAYRCYIISRVAFIDIETFRAISEQKDL